MLLIHFLLFYLSDFGVDNLIDFARQTNFPWLISNVIDNGTSSPLADGKVTCILHNNGIKVNMLIFSCIYLFLSQFSVIIVRVIIC